MTDASGAGLLIRGVRPDADSPIFSMITLGYCLLNLGVLIWLVGYVSILIVARRHGPVSFWACLLLPPVWLVFLVLDFKATWKPALLSFAGLLIALVGCHIAGVDWIDLSD